MFIYFVKCDWIENFSIGQMSCQMNASMKMKRHFSTKPFRLFRFCQFEMVFFDWINAIIFFPRPLKKIKSTFWDINPNEMLLFRIIMKILNRMLSIRCKRVIAISLLHLLCQISRKYRFHVVFVYFAFMVWQLRSHFSFFTQSSLKLVSFNNFHLRLILHPFWR